MESKNTIFDEILLSIPQAAQLLHTRTDKIRELIKKGYIKALRLNEVKIRRQEIDRFLKEAEGKDYYDISDVRELKI